MNKRNDGRIRYYVHPVKAKDVEIVWDKGVPVIRCPESAFGDVIERMAPKKIEYHHLLQWPIQILNAPCDDKEVWLNDSYLWCVAGIR